MDDIEDFGRFEGKDASEAEEFVRSVRVRAFRANKAKDDEWIAMLAGTAFAGNALRWYTTLSPSIRDSWEALQSSILQHYTHSSTSDSLSIPNAPAASPLAHNTVSPAQPRLGRIIARFESELPDTAYLCGDLSGNGVYTWTHDASKALTVRHVPEAQLLEVQDGKAARYYVGAQFWENDGAYTTLGKGGRGYLELTPVKATSAGYTSSLKYGNGGPGKGDITVALWSVGTDGTLLPLLTQGGVRYCLIACVFKASKGVALTSDYAAFWSQWSPNTVERVDLMFEPLKPSDALLQNIYL